MCNYPFLASKQTFARIDFLRPGWSLVDKKAAIMLKSLLKNGQKVVSWQVDE